MSPDDTPSATPVLRTTRAEIRPLAESDFPALDAIVREPSVASWWPMAPGASIRDDLFAEGTVPFAIEVDGVVAGTVTHEEEATLSYRHARVDIMLGTAYQDLGLGTEVLRAVVRYLIGERGHHRVTIDPAVANVRAIRAYEKVGFKPVGVMRRYERASDGTWHDNLLMDLLAEEFVDG